MKSRIRQLVVLLFTAMIVAMPVNAYDHSKADGYANMFASVQGAKAGKALHLINPDQFVRDVRLGKAYVTVDIRTPGETRFFTASLPGHLVIPLEQLFRPEQLARLPEDQPIVLICKSGTRASAAATALRDVGFAETYVLKGGYKALIGYLGPKEANAPLGPKTAAR
ncbi:MAG: rhodanese-like domain-containing protein [Gammaproteobacteria bacterium]|nr:rhodanese-like domain-containing protein [Gammaproteobacteria bacterium]